MTQKPACPLCASVGHPKGTRAGYAFHRCTSCLLLFVWPVPDNTLAIYSDDYFQGATSGFGYVDYDSDKMPMERTFQTYLDRLEALLPKGGRSLFDIGAATGFFLNLARERGWTVRGVEPSSFAAARARDKGLNVQAGIFDTCDVPPESLDAITMWDVIEHLPDPRNTLRLIHNRLKPRGVLAINTPDSGSLLASLLGLRWHLVVPPEHLMLFHRQSLRYLLESESFTVAGMETLGKRFSVQYVSRILAHWQGGRFWRQLSDRLQQSTLGQMGVSINLRDNVTVFARKR